MYFKLSRFSIFIMLVVGILSLFSVGIAQEETPEPQPTEIATEAIPTQVPAQEIPVEITTEPQPEATGDPVITPESTSEIAITNPDPILIPAPENSGGDGRGEGVPQVAIELTPIPGAMQRVIVELNVPNTIVRNGLSVPQSNDIQQAQASLNSTLASLNGFITQSYQLLPMVAMTVDETTLSYLRTSPLVRAIYPDQIRYLQLDYSVPLIGAESAHTSGFDGTGQTIAIIDNGVEATHPFFGGRVVQEACFSEQGVTPFGDATTNCANASTVQFGAGAASPSRCVTNLVAEGNSQASAEDNCSHGTHVAGIAAGEDGNAFGSLIDGVAPGANIIAINVFHTLDSFFGIQIVASDSDIIAGLEYVLSLSSTYDIAAVNMSLGGGRYFSVCDNEFANYYNVVAQLRAAGIAVIAASGNNGYSNSLSAPACVSNIISVGATTTDWSGAGTEDLVEEGVYTMNSASFLNFLAPGYSIVSSEINGTYGIKGGTSMASPHVTGAWAIMRQMSNIATVDQIYEVLDGTGVQVIDPRNSLTFPRINLDLATTQGRVVLGAPIGTIGTTTPTFTWQASANTTWYQLFIYNGASLVFSNWYTAIDAGCNGGGTCTVSFNTPLTSSPGTFTWYVQAWSEAFTGTNIGLPIGPTTFTLQSASLQAPAGVVTNVEARPTYQWASVANATNYRLYVSQGSTLVVDQWVACALSTCTHQPTTQLSNGTYNWWILAWGPTGYSPWSASGSFVVNAAAPIAAVPVAPISNPSLNNPTVTFEWQHATGASWYFLQVNNTSGVAFSRWYQLSELTPNGDNYQVNATINGSGTFTWWVQSYGSGGYGAWSNPGQTFTMSLPPAPTSPTFTNERGDITYQWDHNATNTWYELYVTRASDGSVVLDTWYQVGITSGITCTSTCTVNTGNPLPNGTYNWKVRAYHASGTSAWTADTQVVVNEVLPNAGGIGGFQVMDNEIITTHASPTFEWTDVAGASWYELYVSGPSGLILDKWYVRSQMCSGGTCSINPNLSLTNGAYQWWVLPYGPAGSGGWAGPANFTIALSTAITSTQPVLGSVTDTNTSTPNFNWTAVDGATWYRLWLSGSSGLIFDQWLRVDASCPSSCGWNDPVTLANGNYTWYLQAYGPGGTSLWSNAGNFAVAIPAPAPVTLIAPANNAVIFGANVTFQWSEVANATWYYVRVWKGSTLQTSQWFQSTACTSGTCSAQITLPAGNYTWTVGGWGPGTTGSDYLNNNPTPHNLTMVN